MTNQTTNNNAVAYFNAHTESLGYLDSLVRVMPKPGQAFEAFWTAAFCMLEGNPQHPEKLFVSLSIPSEKTIECFTPFLAEINNPATKVFVGLRLAKFRGEPFLYGENSKTPGLLGINYEARLINVMYLKVGDTVIKLKRDDAQATTDFGVPASSATAKNTTSIVTIGGELFAKPISVKLSRDDIHFEVTKARLKDEGYRWHSELLAWVIPELKLSKNDPRFEQKVQMLKKEGYRWSPEHGSWRMTFSKPIQFLGKPNSTYDQRARHH